MSDQSAAAEAASDQGGSDNAAPTATRDEFAALLEESFSSTEPLEGTVVTGTVIAVENDFAVIDVGLKTEGRVALHEFGVPGQPNEIDVGSTVEVFLDKMENAAGEAVLSRERARREEAWNQLEKAYEVQERVEGIIFGRVKGGFTVDLSGAVAFLPGSQVDVRPIRDPTPLMNIPQPFMILKMDRPRSNIVVSRRSVLEEDRAEQRAELLANLHEGQVLEGIVKNVTDYGAFVDLGGIDGLLHVTDMAWRRINHPSEVLNIGESIKVQVIKVNPETQRISLGMKQLETDPWEEIGVRYPIGTRLLGRVTNITDYGAFVELEPGVEGLVHVSEMSWTKKNVHPGKIISTSQEVDVVVLSVDPAKRRISLGMKQTTDNPWDAFKEQYAVGSKIKGEVKNITEFGLFIGLEGDVDGMVHLSDLDWDRPGEESLAEFNKGDTVEAVVLDVDIEKERISLGIKQLSGDPFAGAAELKRGAIVTCKVTQVTDGGIEVSVGSDGLTGFIRRNELSRDRGDQRPERFAVGDSIDAQVTNIDKTARRLTLSIKAHEVSEEKEAVRAYGSSDSGATLGDILGAAMSKARDSADEDEPEAEAEPEPEAEAESDAETSDEGGEEETKEE